MSKNKAARAARWTKREHQTADVPREKPEPEDDWLEDEDERPDLNREGDPAFNGAFDRW